MLLVVPILMSTSSLILVCFFSLSYFPWYLFSILFSCILLGLLYCMPICVHCPFISTEKWNGRKFALSGFPQEATYYWHSDPWILKDRTIHPEYPGCLQTFPQVLYENRAKKVLLLRAPHTFSELFPWSAVWYRRHTGGGEVTDSALTYQIWSNPLAMYFPPQSTLQHLSQGHFQHLNRGSVHSRKLFLQRTVFSGSFSSIWSHGIDIVHHWCQFHSFPLCFSIFLYPLPLIPSVIFNHFSLLFFPPLV